MHIWCAISGHGYGHAAQVVPVLHQLQQQDPHLQITLRTEVPQSFFEQRLRTPWTHLHAQQDIGCIQKGPLVIDIEQTWRDHRQFHDKWESFVQTECQALTTASPDIILSDISYMAIEAGYRSHIPTIALASLTWDKVLKKLSTHQNAQQDSILQEMQSVYRKADTFLQPYPSLTFEDHPHVHQVGPIYEESPNPSKELGTVLSCSPEDKVVLIGFGGVTLGNLPFHLLDTLSGYRFIMSGPVPRGMNRIISSLDIPLPFNALLASCDIVMTKPGYSTIIDCVALRKPVVYVRRYNFADEEGLVQYLHQYGQGVELAIDAFYSGEWKEALERRSISPHIAVTSPTTNRGTRGCQNYCQNGEPQIRRRITSPLPYFYGLKKYVSILTIFIKFSVSPLFREW